MKLNEFLDDSLDALGKINVLIPLAGTAIKALYERLRAENPELTPAQYIANLATTAGEVKGTAAAWLLSKGYTQAADGTWHAPSV